MGKEIPSASNRPTVKEIGPTLPQAPYDPRVDYQFLAEILPKTGKFSSTELFGNRRNYEGSPTARFEGDQIIVANESNFPKDTFDPAKGQSLVEEAQ